MTPDPAHVAEVRAAVRQVEVGPRYHGWGHLALTTALCSAAFAASASGLAGVGAVELLAIPGTFLFANTVEWAVHRGPMHRPWRGLGAIYARHTKMHHRFFTHDAMRAATHRDFKAVLFPPVLWAMILAVAVPTAVLLGLVAGGAVARLFLCTALGYFVLYEWLHLAYHLPQDGVVGAIPGMAALRRHHTHHHDLRRMAHVNFNITFPIPDAALGTWER